MVWVPLNGCIKWRLQVACYGAARRCHLTRHAACCAPRLPHLPQVAAEKAKEYGSKGWSFLKSAYASAAAAVEQTAAQVAGLIVVLVGWVSCTCRGGADSGASVLVQTSLAGAQPFLTTLFSAPLAPQSGYKVDLGSRKVAATVHATSASGTVGAYHGGFGGGAPSGYQAVGAGDEGQWGSSNGNGAGAGARGGGSYQQPAARDEWGSGWDDAPGGGGAARGSAGGRQQQAAGDAQWSGWDEGGASPSHTVPANGKAAEDDWGKW